MEISILLTILLTIVLLAGASLLGAELSLIRGVVIDASAAIRLLCVCIPYTFAVKLILGIYYMLNYVVLPILQKTTQPILIYPHNLKLVG